MLFSCKFAQDCVKMQAKTQHPSLIRKTKGRMLGKIYYSEIFISSISIPRSAILDGELYHNINRHRGINNSSGFVTGIKSNCKRGFVV